MILRVLVLLCITISLIPTSSAQAQECQNQVVIDTCLAGCSATGTVVMVQEYTTLDPSGLVDMMLTELTKEEVQYGYKITTSQVTKTLADGTQVTGKRAVSTYKGTEYIRHVLCYRVRDAGLLLITQFEKGSPSEEKQIIDEFWRTLKVSFK